MSGRRGVAIAAGVVGALVCAGTAQATNQPAVVYTPPLLKALDYFGHDSVENMVVEREGPNFLLTNTPSGFAISPKSDPGCDYIVSGVACPVSGIERLILRLGPMDDSAQVDLGGSAGQVKQKVVGGPGLDELSGARGAQRLTGGPGDDTLRGGPGRDVLIGGPGDDTCIGGPGKDVLKSCE